MASWTIKYRNTRQIEKVVSRMRPSVRRAFAEVVADMMAQGPRPHGWHVKDLQGDYQGMMSVRLDIRHRMVYSVFSGILVIEIVEVTTRENAYK